MRALLLAALLCACDSGPDGPTQQPPDAPVTFDAHQPMDAPFTCMTIAPRAALAEACLALDPGSLQGATPFGNLDVALDYFGSGDCITKSQASIHWTGNCLEELSLGFSYPVVTGMNGREVNHSFDAQARFTFQPPGMAMRAATTMVHVDVVKWQEGQAGVHDIDITVTITDPLYSVMPIRVHGTFCDWPYYVC